MFILCLLFKGHDSGLWIAVTLNRKYSEFCAINMPIVKYYLYITISKITQLIYVKTTWKNRMTQFFTDDINALLKSGHGDYSRLSRIKAHFEAKKLVTIDDRKYVDGLIARYLQPAIQAEKPERIVKTPEKRIVPPPTPPRQQENIPEMKYQKSQVETIEKTGNSKKLRNVGVGIAAIVFAVLIISIVAMNQDKTTIPSSIAKALETDQVTYAKGDIISISGKIGSTTVKLAINNPDENEVWTETIKVKTGGKFSTLVIAGGSGWEKAGRYTVTSSTGEKTTFEFSPTESQ